VGCGLEELKNWQFYQPEFPADNGDSDLQSNNVQFAGPNGGYLLS
jgi:hypothetical protein